MGSLDRLNGPSRSGEVIRGHDFFHIVRDIPFFYDKFGAWDLHYYHDKDGPYWVRIVGDITKDDSSILFRVDDHCMTGFDLGHESPPDHPEAACDCVQQSELSRAYIHRVGRGVVIHTPLEARGHGPLAKALQLKMQGEALRNGTPFPDTVACFEASGFIPPDIRDYEGVRAILSDLRLDRASFFFMTNNPRKVDELQKAGVNIAQTVNVFAPNMRDYYGGPNFKAKHDALGHDSAPSRIPPNGVIMNAHPL